MARNWRFLPHDVSLVGRLVRELDVSALTAQVLVARGYSDGDAARHFLDPKLLDLHDPNLLPGIEQAAERVLAALADKRRITIYGDYDVDGVTGTSILWHCLRLAGGTVDYYIPSRLDEGYGLNPEAIRKLHEEDPSRLLLTVDCGIASVEEAAIARELGLDLVVTDHHRFRPELPDAILVHPGLPGSEYPFPDLCGAGVALKLAWAIAQRLGDGKRASARMREFLIDAVGLAAVGTVADVVPLHGENRVLVRFGLNSLAHRSSIGMKALMQQAGIDQTRTMNAEDIGFGIGPRINAAGRLGQARLAVELLTTSDEQRAAQLAEYLEGLNKERKTVERRALRQAKELVAENEGWSDAPALVLAHPDWHPGVIGIVASRVVEHFQKPAILIAIDKNTGVGGGSGRSYGEFDLHAGLDACSEHLLTFGGHRAAAGLKIEAERIDTFRDDFCGYIESSHEFTDRDSELRIDAEVRLADVTRRAIRELDRLGPFGARNPRPLFASTNVELAEPPRTMGEGGHHLQLRVRQSGATLRAIAFGKGEWAEEIAAAGKSISISYAPGLNTYRGYENVELQLRDWRPAAG